MKMEKKKLSRFEYAILREVDPVKAQDFEPFTEQEEMQQRHDHLEKRIRQIKFKEGFPKENDQQNPNI